MRRKLNAPVQSRSALVLSHAQAKRRAAQNQSGSSDPRNAIRRSHDSCLPDPRVSREACEEAKTNDISLKSESGQGVGDTTGVFGTSDRILTNLRQIPSRCWFRVDPAGIMASLGILDFRYGVNMAISLSIKSVPEDLAARLRERAKRNHRSLQGELMAIIKAAANEPPDDKLLSAAAAGRGVIVGFDRGGRSILRKGTRPIEEIAAELRRLTPEPRDDLPLSVDIIREMRDSR